MCVVVECSVHAIKEEQDHKEKTVSMQYEFLFLVTYPTCFRVPNNQCLL